MKNKGETQDVKQLKEPKHQNTWQCTFLSITHFYNSKDVPDAMHTPDPTDADVCTVLAYNKSMLLE